MYNKHIRILGIYNYTVQSYPSTKKMQWRHYYHFPVFTKEIPQEVPYKVLTNLPKIIQLYRLYDIQNVGYFDPIHVLLSLNDRNDNLN